MIEEPTRHWYLSTVLEHAYVHARTSTCVLLLSTVVVLLVVRLYDVFFSNTPVDPSRTVYDVE